MNNAVSISRRRSSAGFTLIELMVVVVVIGILSAIAWPSYQGYVKKTRRADAQADLMELSHHIERYYTQHGKYTGVTLPFTKSPKDGSTIAYNLSLTASATATTYKLQAVPTNSMSGDECGTLTLDQLGRKTSGGSLSNCWRN